MPKYILIYNNDIAELYSLKTDIKNLNNIMYGAFSIVLTYETFLNNIIIVKTMVGNNKQIANEIKFYDIVKGKKDYEKYICKYYGSFREHYEGNDYNYLFLEKLEIDLYDYIYGNKYKQYNYNFCIRLLKNICENLIFLHKQGFVYNDLKLENLMINSTGFVKLIDFNCISSKKFKWKGSGTLEYMSPEVIRNIRSNQFIIDPKSDSWSFGLLIYELFTRLPSPFFSEIKYDVIKKTLENKYNNYHEAENLFKLNCIFKLTETKDILKIFCNCLKTSYESRPSLKSILKILTKLSKNHED